MRRISAAPACEVHTCRMACATSHLCGAGLRRISAALACAMHCRVACRHPACPKLAYITTLGAPFAQARSLTVGPALCAPIGALRLFVAVPEHPPQQQAGSVAGGGAGGSPLHAGAAPLGSKVPAQASSQFDAEEWHHPVPSVPQPAQTPPQAQHPPLPTGVGTGDGALVGVGEPSAICQQICPYAALRYPKYLTTVFSSMSSK